MPQAVRHNLGMAPPALARTKIEAVGLDSIIERLGQGDTQTQIANEIGVSVMSLNRALHDNPINSARVLEAQTLSAERFELEAIDILLEAQQQIRDEPQISGAIVALARERAQAAWRQAGTRDWRKYSDKRTATLDVTVTHTAQLSTQDLERIASQALTLLPDGTVSDEGG